ncbi:class I SAM-dependent methyltransferase [Streptomyces sp. S.PNR 29]|uniref:class I SAM-dependent methyltransferase n=1 Tax=Streptomyces sp. S.PNR 29 TaxID=2973805 RepID=UPI0025B1D042|nr:class I SAM-dependent methyltransferase [Streptomyces sp. S.PNR 29]MDN0194685.1 class I SAM-dependent methyltransferase [Streptomyces sp. S.PNR 29]
MSAPPAPRARQTTARRRAAYLAYLAEGTDRFQEPPREDCPWCGSQRLRTRLRAGDLRLHKPGRFLLAECRDCVHTFQNPRLTAEGVTFYHRDLDEGRLAGVVARTGVRRGHRSAARAMLRFTEPESWLDVGTGHARFPQRAREFFPYTAFDGLDTTWRVQRAQAAGRVEEAYIGHLTDPHIRARLRARYDVVSMLQHLHHTPDPREELRAALDVLRPGGHLLVELPDPRSVFALLLGKWWLPYDQPRHLHLPPPANLRAELEARGCTVLAVDRRTAHVPYDLAGAFALALSHALPAPDTPWRAIPPTRLQRGLRATLLAAGLPLVAAAWTADHALAPLLRHTPFANAYRLIARKGASAA